MADFAEVMLAATEMHNQFEGHCTRCPLSGMCIFDSDLYLTKDWANEMANTVLKWKESNAPKYPSWTKALGKSFSQCLRVSVPNELLRMSY